MLQSWSAFRLSLAHTLGEVPGERLLAGIQYIGLANMTRK
jgi:hypothetical protein